jgi:hypothetical protein
MAYDRRRGVTVLFGGFGTVPYRRDTWEWDGQSWTLRATDGPPGRGEMGMCYDSVREVVLLFGGTDVEMPGEYVYYQDTWAWDGNSWSQLATGGPRARDQHAMAFDDARGVAVVFSGAGSRNTTLNDAWEWDGAEWREVAADPPGRWRGTMAYVSSRQAISLYGGSTNSSRRTDHWDLVVRPAELGDLNCDCSLNAFDIEPFLVALIDPAGYAVAYPDCDIRLADVNGSGSIDSFDIEPFIDLLVAP